MTPFEEILRRRRQRQAWDERLPDGRSVSEVLADQGRPPAARTPPGDVNAGEGQALLTERNREAVTRPRRTYNTSLSPQEEAQYEIWKQRYAPNDSGDDYDLRGAFSAGVTPDAKTGHWPDRFKKPNHPTFSNESQYATGSDAAGAGRWNGEEYIPASRNAERQRAVTFNPETGRPNEGYYRERNDPSGLYNAYQNWTPHGGKRGFKNALKAGALAAASIAQNTDDPLAILTALGTGAAGGAVNPNFKNNLVRRFKLAQVGNELGSQLKLQREQANIDASQMVPVTLDNGQTVMVPAKTAGTLQSRQQEIDLRGNTLEARKNRWNQLGEHEAARDAQALYNSGAADDSAELRAEIARRLRLPAGTVLPPRNAGSQIKVDEFGNYTVINPRSGVVTDTGRGAFVKTQEVNRDTRQRNAIAAAKERVQMQQTGATERTRMQQAGQDRRKQISPETAREIAKGVGSIEAVKNELAKIDADIKQLDDAAKGRQQTPDEVKQLTALGRKRQQKVDEAKAMVAQLDALDPNNETGVGAGGYPYRKPRAQQASDLNQPIYPKKKGSGQYAGRSISRANVAEYGRRHGMTPEQAEAFLKKEGAVIY